MYYKTYLKSIIFFPFFVAVFSFFLVSCSNGNFNNWLIYTNNKNKVKNNKEKDNFIENCILNLKYGYPFYIIKKECYLLSSPKNNINQKKIKLQFGDIVEPILPLNIFVNDAMDISETKFLCKTKNGNIGWLNFYDGISVDYNSDKNLFYFSDKEDFYYLSKFKKDLTGNSEKVVLMKNIIPSLLGNDKTSGFFYPIDYKLALELSKYAVSIAIDQDTFFYSWTMTYNWRVNELLISLNLLADSYFKLKEFDKAIEIHETILKRHFWKRTDNTQIGGLNSLIKLEKIYIELLKNCDKKSKNYRLYINKIIEIAQKMDDTTNYFYLVDKEWDKSVAEWYISNLFESFDDETFFKITNELLNNLTSIGFKEFITIYQAIRHYNNKNTEEAFRLINTIKPKEDMIINLNIYEYLSQIQLIPDFLARKLENKK